MITEFQIDGGRADLLVVTKAGYATEVEIKISKKDWRADDKKPKFMAQRPHISRLFYAVPEQLMKGLDIRDAASLPRWIRPHVGILVVRDGGLGYDSVRELRAARRFRCRPLTEQHQAQIATSFYYRFWRQHMEIQRQRLFPAERTAA